MLFRYPGSLIITPESLKFQPSKSRFADTSVILLRDIQKAEACELLGGIDV
jgi:hypothetical protein